VTTPHHGVEFAHRGLQSDRLLGRVDVFLDLVLVDQFETGRRLAAHERSHQGDLHRHAILQADLNGQVDLRIFGYASDSSRAPVEP